MNQSRRRVVKPVSARKLARKCRKKGSERLARKLGVEFTRSDDEKKVVWKQLAG